MLEICFLENWRDIAILKEVIKPQSGAVRIFGLKSFHVESVLSSFQAKLLPALVNINLDRHHSNSHKFDGSNRPVVYFMQRHSETRNSNSSRFKVEFIVY